MNILLVYAQAAGSNFYRLEMPHHYLGENNSDIHLWSVGDIDEITDFTKYDFVLFSRGINYAGRTKEIAERIKKDTLLVLDLDDYWQLGTKHILYNSWYRDNIHGQTKEAIELADYVICTTKYLAASIKGINRNVTVIENAVFPENYKQFEYQPSEPSDILRLGWLGGSCHVEDMELLYPLGKDCYEQKIPVHFCIANDGVKESVYDYYRMIVTHNKGTNYTALPTCSVYEYGLHYRAFDVALAPLRKTDFNVKKSELKVIEAGFWKKALIVSKVKPYTDICNSKNSLLCEPHEWTKAVKTLLKNPNMVKDLGEQLFIDVQKFHIKEINKKREALYKSICTKSKNLYLELV